MRPILCMGLLGLVACAPYPYAATEVSDRSATMSGTGPYSGIGSPGLRDRGYDPTRPGMTGPDDMIGRPR